jgi:hypothetical protein
MVLGVERFHLAQRHLAVIAQIGNREACVGAADIDRNNVHGGLV